MAKKKIILMEHIWLVLSILTVTLFIYSTIVQGFKDSYILLIFSGISALMFLWRRNLRKNEDNSN
ncbi:MAG: hypothetical protein JXR68_10690 [Bacteroidales bacterium]|nr:hypothetical protein [Bacteroidales bacterium]